MKQSRLIFPIMRAKTVVMMVGRAGLAYSDRGNIRS